MSVRVVSDIRPLAFGSRLYIRYWIYNTTAHIVNSTYTLIGDEGEGEDSIYEAFIAFYLKREGGNDKVIKVYLPKNCLRSGKII